MEESIPISTQLSSLATNTPGKNAIKSVYMIVNKTSGSKGSGFLLQNGFIITNKHVIGSNLNDDIIAISSNGHQYTISKKIIDADRDLAAIKTDIPISGGLLIDPVDNIELGTTVSTWGYPLYWNGPNPLLSVGYIAGYKLAPRINNGKNVKAFVINGALNNGNSGGPLIRFNDDKIIGVVVSKALPIISPFAKQAIDCFSTNKSGVVFNATDEKGKVTPLVESQVVSIILKEFHEMHQVMIGDAISSEELIAFLKQNSIELSVI